MSSVESQRQSADELTAHFPEAVRTFVKTALLEVHTCLPGIVKDFDSATMTVAVQPAIERKFVREGYRPLPRCVQVPVQFPRAGNFILTFPVQDGDEVLLCFAERNIDNWWARGGVQRPASPRMHNLSDGFALLGFSSKPKAAQVTGVSGDACELRSLDGSIKIRIEGSMVYLGDKVAGIGGLGSRPPLVMDPNDATDPMTMWMAAVGSFCSAGPPSTAMVAQKVKAK